MSRWKTEAVLRMLGGEDLDVLSRELGVTAGTVAQWRELFLAGGQAAMKSRLADERDDELGRPRAKRECYNRAWLIERHGHQTPSAVRAAFAADAAA